MNDYKTIYPATLDCIEEMAESGIQIKDLTKEQIGRITSKIAEDVNITQSDSVDISARSDVFSRMALFLRNPDKLTTSLFHTSLMDSVWQGYQKDIKGMFEAAYEKLPKKAAQANIDRFWDNRIRDWKESQPRI